MKFTKKQQDYLLRLLSECTTAAYKSAGFVTVKLDDGSIGVARCPPKLMGTVDAVQGHFAVALGAAKYADKTMKPVTVPAQAARTKR